MSFDIKKRRETLGLTLEEIGNFVGVSKGTVKKWESGYIKNMRRDKIIKLAQVLKISPMDILWMDSNNTPRINKKVALTKEIKKQYREFILSVFDVQDANPAIVIYQDKSLILINSNNKVIDQILELIK